MVPPEESTPKSPFNMKLRIVWHGTEKSKRLKDYKLTNIEQEALKVDAKFRVKPQHSQWFLLTSQHAATFSKLKLERDWTYVGPDGQEWERATLCCIISAPTQYSRTNSAVISVPRIPTPTRGPSTSV